MKKLLLFGLISLVVIFWGNAFVAIKYILDKQYTDAMGLTALRHVPAAVILLVVLFTVYDASRVLDLWRREWKGIALYGLTGVLGYNLSLNYGEMQIAPGTASLIVGLSPVLTLIGANLALGERITSRKLLGIIMAFIGLFIVVRWGTNDPISFKYLLFMLITFGAPLSWMFYNIVGKPLVDRNDPALVTMSAMVWGTVPLVFFIPPKAALAAIPGSGWLALGFLSLACSIFGFLVWSWALKQTEAARLGAVVYLIPLVTIVSSIIILHQPVTPGLVAGGVVLIAGVVIAET